eukprot:6797833-Pyramimonas_sp.AAC.1
MAACSGSVPSTTPPTAGAAGEVVEHPSLETLFLRTILVDKLEKTEARPLVNDYNRSNTSTRKSTK